MANLSFTSATNSPSARSASRERSASAGGVGSVPALAIRPNSLPGLVLLHLLPGLAGTLGYVLLAPLLVSRGYPAVLALLLAALLVILPIELGLVLAWAGAKRGFSLEGVVLLRKPMPRWQWALLPLALVLWAFLASAMTPPLDNVVLKTWFGWLPAWMTILDPRQLLSFSRPALEITFWVGLAVNGVALPVVEELYFRGILLPRLDRLGRWAPAANTVLFSVYHFWTPWQVLSRILWLLPWVYLVWIKRNLYPMMIAHCIANTLGWLLFWGSVLG
jgi:membrane protease YdiL (CAAX protease family)